MRTELDFEEEIAPSASPDSRAALPGQADMLALAHPFGDAYVQGARLYRRPAAGAGLGVLERYRAGLAGVCVFEVDEDFRVGVFAARVELAPGRTGEAAARRGAPEQAVEEIAELLRRATREAAAVELESLVPVRGRTKVLARLPFRAEAVVSGALLRVLQDLVGLAELLEARLRVRLLAHVRMKLARELAVGPLDLVLGGVPVDAHHRVVVLVAHGTNLGAQGAESTPP